MHEEHYGYAVVVTEPDGRERYIRDSGLPDVRYARGIADALARSRGGNARVVKVRVVVETVVE